MKQVFNHIKSWLLLGLLFVTSAAGSQNISDLIYAGDALYLEGNYYSASQYYLKALAIDSTRLRVAYSYADCCRLFFSYEEAEKMYTYVISRDDRNKFPGARFWQGMMNKSLGRYPEASLSFQRYCRENPDVKSPFYARSRHETEACRWADEAVRKMLPLTMDHPGSPINSEYADFGALKQGDSLLYLSSMKADNDLPFQSAQQPSLLTRLYESRITPPGASTPQPLPPKINEEGYHLANLCFSANHQVYFYSRCADERRADLQCEIFMVYRKGGKWQKPVKLDNAVNTPAYTATQPAIAHGEKEDLLFFVSDRPGGFGGKDIWYATIKRGKVGKPSNLGSIINTPGDEITPFFDNKSQTLFFSSDYHTGFGGFDIFRSKGLYNQWTKPVNAGYPLNTPYNDLYFTVNETDTNGYLTSNRPGSFYLKNQTCCNDIWTYIYNIKESDALPFVAKAEDLPVDTANPVTATGNESIIRLFLPLTLYFDNDEPDPATMSESTDKNYRTTVADYFLQKEKYKEEYSKGLRGRDRLRAENDIEDFFNDYILSGLRQLEEFTLLLADDLENGNSISITIKGYSSPLNTADYNRNLAKRRITSLINYFREYRDGLLIPYMNGTADAGNRLTFREEPIGETQSSSSVSDNPNDQRNSVYSRAAALERRIQILYYEEKGAE